MPHMTSVSDRYERAARGFSRRVDAVQPDAWARPSPCDGWTARDVVGHVIGTHLMFLGFVGRGVEGPSVDDDPKGAYAAASHQLLRALVDPTAAAAAVDGFFGPTLEEGVDNILTGDIVIHTWDLARAVGGDERLDPDEVDRYWKLTPGIDDAVRVPGIFGAALAPPEGADPQTKLLAFLGRRSW